MFIISEVKIARYCRCSRCRFYRFFFQVFLLLVVENYCQPSKRSVVRMYIMNTPEKKIFKCSCEISIENNSEKPCIKIEMALKRNVKV